MVRFVPPGSRSCQTSGWKRALFSEAAEEAHPSTALASTTRAFGVHLIIFSLTFFFFMSSDSGLYVCKGLIDAQPGGGSTKNSEKGLPRNRVLQLLSLASAPSSCLASELAQARQVEGTRFSSTRRRQDKDRSGAGSEGSYILYKARRTRRLTRAEEKEHVGHSSR